MPGRFPIAAMFAALGAVGCILLTIAAYVLGRIAWRMTGAADIFSTLDPATLAQMQQVWGLFLAANIVKLVLACSFTTTLWFAWLALPMRGSLALASIAVATLGGGLLVAGYRLGIRASAHLSNGVAPHWAELSGTLAAAGIACAGVAFALFALAGRRCNLLPAWMVVLGIALALLGLASGLHFYAGIGFAFASLAWWAGLMPPLLRNQPNTATL